MRDRTGFAGKLSDLLRSDRKIQSASDDDGGNDNDARSSASPRYSSDQFTKGESALSSPYSNMSPWNPAASPFVNSPWIHPSSAAVSLLPDGHDHPAAGLIGSLIREEGHVYSLATDGDLLYTGSDSKNIRVWKRWREFGGFKSGSGLVKAIVVAPGGKIFTGHQDGKIRVWRISPKDPSVHKRVGTLPKFKDLVRTSVNPSNYVEVRRRKSAVWIRHFDAVSCLSLDAEAGLLYSGSWDRTVKVWRLSDSRCLESIRAHDDAVNAVAVAPGGLVFTGSADGTVKLWRREEGFRHVEAGTMLRQESAVTALAVAGEFVYSGSSDGAVNVWERRRRGVEKCGTVLQGHRMAVLCLAAAGNLVASGSADGTVRVWRREAEGQAHALVSVLARHTAPVKCLAIEADKGWCSGGAEKGRWVVYSGSLDRSVKVWQVSDSALDTASPPQEATGSAHDEHEPVVRHKGVV